jgi:hypothetical protein
MAKNAADLMNISADVAIETAINSLLASYSSIKTSDQLGANVPTLDRIGAMRILVRRLLKKNVTNGVRRREASSTLLGITQ